MTQGSLSFVDQVDSNEMEGIKTVDIYQCRCCVGAVVAYVPVKEIVCGRGKKMRKVAEIDRKNSNMLRKYVEEGYRA